MKYVVSAPDGKLVGPFDSREEAIACRVIMFPGQVSVVVEVTPAEKVEVVISNERAVLEEMEKVCGELRISLHADFVAVSNQEMLNELACRVCDKIHTGTKVSYKSLREMVKYVMEATVDQVGFSSEDMAVDLMDYMWSKIPRLETLD